MGDSTRTAVTVLTGFLGAGKTTLLRALLSSGHVDASSTGLIINDLAEVNVDARLVAETRGVSPSLTDSAEDVHGACACCSGRAELVQDLRRLAHKTPPLKHVILECSGMADPANIVKAVMKLESEWCSPCKPGIALSSVVAVLDSSTLWAWISSSPLSLDPCAPVPPTPASSSDESPSTPQSISHLFVSQVETASIVVLHKVDRVTASQLSSCLNFVKKLNPCATLECAKFGVLDPGAILSPPVPYSLKMAKWVHMQKRHTSETPCVRKDSLSPRSEASREGTELSAGREEKHSPAGSGHSEQQHTCSSSCGSEHVTSEGKGEGQVEEGNTVMKQAVSSFVFRASRPFHPDRLQLLIRRMRREMSEMDGHAVGTSWQGSDGEKERGAAMESENGEVPVMQGVLRSKGLVWVAPHTDLSREWSQTRGVFELQKGQPWEDTECEEGREHTHSANCCAENRGRRQEIVFIGTREMDEGRVRGELSACLLNDEEYAWGPQGWRERLKDKIALTLTVSARTEASRQPQAHGSTCPCCDPRLKEIMRMSNQFM